MPTSVPGLGEADFGRGADRARDAEVGHDRVALLEQDVLRLDVPVDDLLPVGVVERVGNLTGEAERLRRRRAGPPAQPVAQRAAFDVGGDVVEQPPASPES